MRLCRLARRMILAPALALALAAVMTACSSSSSSSASHTASAAASAASVGDGSFCQLLALENGGKAPPVCSSAA
jgi:hypothetical protein